MLSNLPVLPFNNFFILFLSSASKVLFGLIFKNSSSAKTFDAAVFEISIFDCSIKSARLESFKIFLSNPLKKFLKSSLIPPYLLCT